MNTSEKNIFIATNLMDWMPYTYEGDGHNLQAWMDLCTAWGADDTCYISPNGSVYRHTREVIGEWSPATHIHDAMEAEERLRERGPDVMHQYVMRLMYIMNIICTYDDAGYAPLFALIHASPEQRTNAMVRVLGYDTCE